MSNQSQTPLLPRFIAAVTACALVSTSLARPALAAEPAVKAAPKAAGKATPALTKAGAKPADANKGPDKKTREAARKAYGEGEKAYATGDYAGAYAGFSRANELIPSNQASYWIAKSLDGQGKTDEAIAAYEKLLADADIAKLGDDKSNDAKARLELLKAKLVGEVTLSSIPIGAAVAVDGVPQATGTPIVLKLAPGPHKVSVSANGFEPQDIDLTVKGGEKVEQKLELIVKPAPPPPPPEPVVEAPPPPLPPPPPPARSKVPAYITLGIAGAGAVVGTIFGVKALSAKSDYDDKPSGGTADDTERNALIADMAFGVAITLGVTGIVLLTSDDPAPSSGSLERLPKRAKLVVAPYASPQGGGAAARLTF